MPFIDYKLQRQWKTTEEELNGPPNGPDGSPPLHYDYSLKEGRTFKSLLITQKADGSAIANRGHCSQMAPPQPPV